MSRIACLCTLLSASLLLALLLHAPSAAAQDAPRFFQDGKVSLDLRYRVESVDDDRQAKDAFASTLRTALGLRSAEVNGFSVYLEAENVTALGNEDGYRNAGAGSLNNGVSGRPVVADPELTEVNQAYGRYQREGLQLTLGRQEILLGDQRYVGAVGWRQNHQSFDALRLEWKASDRFRLDYSFVDNTNRIFGDNKQMASHLLYLPVQLTADVQLTAYSFLLDYDRPADAHLSTATFGAELSGKLAAGQLRFEAEYASQQDHADNPNRVRADYLKLSAGTSLGSGTGGVNLDVAYEVLEGSFEDGRFLTPLATLHKFNGWADLFLVTPPQGLEDLSISLAGKQGQVAWRLTWHDFQAESTSIDYGQEIDVLLTYKAPWGQTFGVKGMFYDADDFAADIAKVAVWSGFRF